MNEQETVSRIVALLAEGDPFTHVRYGDGDVFFATHTGPVLTGDGEEWTPVLQQKLLYAWMQLARAKSLVLLGDLETYAVSDGCEPQWRQMLAMFEQMRKGKPTELVHMEALRVGFGWALPIYRALRNDPRSKVYVCPQRLEPIASCLGAWHFEIPLHTAHADAAGYAALLLEAEPEVVLFSAGRGGKIMQGYVAAEAPDVTQIDVGSGLDLLIPDGVRRGTDLGIDRERIVRLYREAGLAL